MNTFVPLTMQILALKELQKSTLSQGKFILLIGKSGLGKSFLLNKLCEDKSFVLFSQPFFDESAFYQALCGAISEDGVNLKSLNFEILYKTLQKNINKPYIFVCDEVGMYDENLLEKMRILSDLPHIFFILSTHKKHKIFNKEHFASRIAKEIWLKNLNLEDLSLYARQKFALLHLSKRQLKWLLNISESNLRNIDKILDTFKKLSRFYKEQKQDKSAQTLLKMSAFYHGILR